MADLTCLIELKVGSNAGIVEESTLPCIIPTEMAVPDFGLTGAVLVPNLSCGGGTEVGVQVWSSEAESQPVVVPLETGVDIEIDCGVSLGTTLTVPLEIGVVISSNCSLALGVLLSKDLGPAVGMVITPNMGLLSPAITTVAVDLLVGTKVESTFGLIAVDVGVLAINTMATPIAKSIGASMSLSTLTPPAAKVLSGIITMKVGASLGLVSNALPVTVVLCNGGTAIGGSFLESADIAEIFETWVLTGNKFGASVYSGFEFNSYARYRGQEYAAGPDGIYLLGGPDDDGQPIHPGIRIVTNFASEKHKRLRSIHLGECGDRAQVRIEADTGEGVFEPEDNGNRAVISRNLESQQFTLDIMDFAQLSHLEISVLPLNKR